MSVDSVAPPISHITLVCADVELSARLFGELLGAVEVYDSGDKHFSIAREKFLLVGSLWLALIEGASIERSYNHIAFHVRHEDLPVMEAKIRALGLEVAPARPRDAREGQSLYFYDYDNHLFELHSGDLPTRLRYYQNGLQVRAAARSEMQWINSCYDEVGFVPSVYEREVIAVAVCDIQRVGVGRLVTIDDAHLELGGIYVAEAFRRRGIASKLIQYLLAQAASAQTVYCLPFAHLEPLYRRWGFRPCPNVEAAPPSLLAKWRWCQQRYPHPTDLLVLPPS